MVVVASLKQLGVFFPHQTKSSTVKGYIDNGKNKCVFRDVLTGVPGFQLRVLCCCTFTNYIVKLCLHIAYIGLRGL